MVSAEPAPDPRAHILDVATRLFAARGFGDTSLQLIADEVGVTKQAVLHHFSSKEALRQAVIDVILDHWRDVLPRVLLAAAASEDRFDAVLGELYRFFAADPDRGRLLVRELFDRPAEAKRVLAESVRPWLDAVASYITRGREAGHHHAEVDPEVYVLHIMQLVISATASASVIDAAIEPGKDTRARYERELMRIARASLFKPPAHHERSKRRRGEP